MLRFTLTINPPIANILAFQPEFRPVIPTVDGNVDYQEFRKSLERMDEILVAGGIENKIVALRMKRRATEVLDPGDVRQSLIFQEHTKKAFRCNQARTLLGEGFRGMSTRMADSPLLQRFCLIDRIDRIQVPSKSTLQRYAEWFNVDEMRTINGFLLKAAGPQEERGGPGLDLKKSLDLEEYFLDTSCVKANVHFPVDWVLLRDATRTLMKAVQVIRKHGLKHRMGDPEGFLRRMNGLSMQMTHTRRKEESKKERKRVLRLMKKQVKGFAAHARRHRQLLDQRWKESDLTRPQAEQILRRIDGVLGLLPQGQKQAHERIIGERKVENAEKILSLYER